MNKRKMCCVMLVMALLLCAAGSTTAAAAETRGGQIAPRFTNTMSTTASIANISGDIYATGTVMGYSSRTTKINGFLYLQRKSGNSWTTVRGWSDTTTETCLLMEGSASNLSAGTYRTRFVSYVFEGSSSEEVVTCSKEMVYTPEQ